MPAIAPKMNPDGGTVRARRFILVDGTGKTVAALQMNESNAPSQLEESNEPELVVFGTKGGPVATFGVEEQVDYEPGHEPSLFDLTRKVIERGRRSLPFLRFFDDDKAASSPRVEIKFAADVGGELKLDSDDGSITLAAGQKGEVTAGNGLTLFGSAASVSLIGDRKNSASISLMAGPGKIITPAKRVGSVEFPASEGVPFASMDLQIDKTGEGSISLSENFRPRALLGTAELETLRTGATEKTSPSSLTLFDKSGRVLWSAP